MLKVISNIKFYAGLLYGSIDKISGEDKTEIIRIRELLKDLCLKYDINIYMEV